MSNHIHILLEVPPMAAGGISDDELLKRLGAIYTEAYVAGVAEELAEYRWSSYGEAVGGGPKGDGKKARAGLVRACMSHHGAGFEAEKWKEVSRICRRAMGWALERKAGGARAEMAVEGRSADDSGGLKTVLDLSTMLGHRVRYFTDGALIGSEAFVNEAFAAARERFTETRKDGARRILRTAQPASTWVFEPVRECLIISCTAPGAVLTGRVPVPDGRTLARLLDKDGVPVTWQ